MNYLDIFYLVMFIVWLLTLVLLIVRRRAYELPDQKLSLITKILVGLVSLIVLFIFSSSIGTIYYYAFHPDYKLDTASSAAGFHIYIPSYLPAGMEQRTVYRVLNKESGIVVGQQTISWAYGMPLVVQAKTDNSVLTIRETEVDNAFDLNGYLKNLEQKSTSSGIFEEISQSNSVGKTYIRQMKLSSGKVIGPSIYILTPDEVLINVNSTTSQEETLKLIKSLK
jgi:hypothetical protein